METNIGFTENENDFILTTYGIGSMEKTAENDDGSAQRIEVAKELSLRNVFFINPVKLEKIKTGRPTEEMKEKMRGWIMSGNWALFKEASQEIWKGRDIITEDGNLYHVPGDIDYVAMSDFVTFNYHKGDKPCGSLGEAYDAMRQGIPIYLITDILKTELPMSLLQWITISEGEVFNSLFKYLEFIDKKYKLHRKEK
jgi:hypothetical protein